MFGSASERILMLFHLKKRTYRVLWLHLKVLKIKHEGLLFFSYRGYECWNVLKGCGKLSFVVFK